MTEYDFLITFRARNGKPHIAMWSAESGWIVRERAKQGREFEVIYQENPKPEGVV